MARSGVEGSLDAVDAEAIFGWAWNRAQHDKPIQVRIWADDTPLATVTADQFRQDLLDAGVGNGKHGFSVPIPAILRDGKPHTIRVTVEGAVDDWAPSFTLMPTRPRGISTPAHKQLNPDDFWEELARTEPYWAVLTADEFRAAKLDDKTKDRFYASGEQHIQDVLRLLSTHCSCGARFQTSLDFGCGVGRCSSL